MAKCLVTGGAGFIGSHVVEMLLKRGRKVRVFDNLSTGSKRNLTAFRRDIEFMRGDVRDTSALRHAVKGVSHIFHLAAVRAVGKSVDDPLETNEVNGTGTLNLLMAARAEGVRRVVYSSSSAVYGNCRRYPTRETNPPGPESPYAASKLLGEYYCTIFTRLFGLETVCLRYFNVYGPRQNPESKYSAVIPIFIYRLLKGRRPEIHGDGKQSRDFHYVDSVADANWLAIKVPKASGEVFNVASREEHSVLEIFRNLRKMLGKPAVEPRFLMKRPGDVRRTLADIAKARRILGYHAVTSFRQGLQKTADWFLNSGVLNELKL